MKPIQTYPATGIMVTFDPNLCIHSAVCLKSLPTVFDTKRKPWIHADAATVEQIVATIDKCPSRALKYVLEGGATSEDRAGSRQVESVTTIQLTTNGPLMIKGAFVVLDESGKAIKTADGATLCRCGATNNPPFCDGSHLITGFQSQGKANK